MSWCVSGAGVPAATVLFRKHDWDVDAEGRRPLLPIHLQSDPTVRPGSCCRGMLRDIDDILGNEPLGLSTGTDAPFRFRIAKELRRVLSRLHDVATRGWWNCGGSRLRWLLGRAGTGRCSV